MSAWAAPRGPTIDQHGDLVAADVFVKSGFVQVGGVSVKQGFFTLAAGGRAAELIGADAVGGVAVGANDVACISHIYS